MRNAARCDGAARSAGLPVRLLASALLGACSTAAPGATDGGASDAHAQADARPTPDAAPGQPDAQAFDAAPPDVALGPYRHTIAIDGALDFGAGDGFATTTGSYDAYLTWDDDNLYLGYQASDVASGDATKWLFVYVDRNPGEDGGSATGEAYNTQTPGFADGFRPDFYYRRQASGGVEDIKTFAGDAWTTTSENETATVFGEYLEVALPLTRFGSPTHLAVTAFWLDEQDLSEWSYGGLYADSFTDGYHAALPVGRYLDIDLASFAAPNDASHQRP